MIDLTKLFSEAELQEWKGTLISWEAEGTIEDPENVEEWIEELSIAFEKELQGETLDEETVARWRKQLAARTKKARKIHLREKEEKQKAQERFIELRTEGQSFSKISKELGIPRETLLEWQGTLERRLQEARYLRLEGLAEEYGAKREARVETYGSLLLRLREEIGKRDLSDMPTEKLLNLSMTLQEKLQNELSPVRLSVKAKNNYGGVESAVCHID